MGCVSDMSASSARGYDRGPCSTEEADDAMKDIPPKLFSSILPLSGTYVGVPKERSWIP